MSAGNPIRLGLREKEKPVCRFRDCGKPISARSLCHGHYRQWRLGKPLATLRFCRPKGSPPVIHYYEAPCPNRKLTGPCHIFLGTKTDGGYGTVWVGGHHVCVHRYTWERDVGPIPYKKEIDHRCRVRACCNTAHLRVVTRKVNVTENVVNAYWQINAAKTHCPRGHAYDTVNTKILKNGGRACKACRVAYNIARRKTAIRNEPRGLRQRQPT